MTWLSLNPIPPKDRVPMTLSQYGQIDVIDDAFVPIDKTGIHIYILAGSVICIMLEPGTRVSHAAVRLAAQVRTLLVWVGRVGIRVYASGRPGGARSDKLLYQARLVLDEDLHLKVVRRMFELRFGGSALARCPVGQLRGIKSSHVRATYALLAKQYSMTWNGRRYGPKDWERSDMISQYISTAISCLYGVTEVTVLVAGYVPAIGFVHIGEPLFFVYDIADVIKFDTVIPKAFEIARHNPGGPNREVHLAYRDIFRSSKTLAKLISPIEDALVAGEIQPPTLSGDT